MIVRTTALALTSILAPTMAAAFWDVETTAEDVFGNSTMTASSFGDSRNVLRFECETNSEPFFAFLARDGSGDVPELPAQFVHVDANGDRHVAEATLTSWNDNYIAFRVTDQEAMRRLAEHMKTATRDISVGAVVPSLDYQVSDSFSSSGSTNAGNNIIEYCLGE